MLKKPIIRGTILLLSLGVMAPAAAQTPPPPPPPPGSVLPTAKHQCFAGGWQDFKVFKNQGDCVSFVATKGKNPPALTPPPPPPPPPPGS